MARTLPKVPDFPPGLIEIGAQAFYDCSRMAGQLALPETVRSVGNFAFIRCTGITGTLSMPEAVKTVGDYAFADCTGLVGALQLPGFVNRIGWNAFAGCSGITILTLGLVAEFTRGLDRHCRQFYRCTGLRAVSMPPDQPETALALPDDAFDDCAAPIAKLLAVATPELRRRYLWTRKVIR